MTTTDNPIEAVRARLDGGRRWIKDTLHNDQGSCLLGAVTVVCKPSMSEQHRQEFGDVTRALSAVIGEQFPERTSGRIVAIFNDHRDTTWADVDLVLDKASIAWDEQVRP